MIVSDNDNEFGDAIPLDQARRERDRDPGANLRNHPNNKTPGFGPQRVFNGAVDLSKWIDKDPPPQKFLVSKLIPAGEVTLVPAPTSTGKSYILLQLMIAAASGGDWFGYRIEQQRPIGVFAEDSEEVLVRRTKTICDMQGIAFEDIIPNMLIHSRKRDDNGLVDHVDIIDQGKRQRVHELTHQYELLNNLCQEYEPGFIILDSLYDYFTGNENARADVRNFVKNVHNLALDCGSGTLIIPSHPSRRGMADGDMTSGSTAWESSVRSRVILKRDVDNEDHIILENDKLNYGKRGHKIIIQWADHPVDEDRGCFKRVDDNGQGGAQYLEAHAEQEFLKRLTEALEEGEEPSPSERSPKGYVVKIVLNRSTGFKKQTLMAAYDRLRNTGRTKVVLTDETKSKQKKIVVPAEYQPQSLVATRIIDAQIDGDLDDE